MTREEYMTEEEFKLLKELIDKEFGILIKGDKRLTLHAKISHRLKILGLKTYGDYYKFILGDASRKELYTLISHITNNETYFFREKSQLDAFSQILKDVKREKQKSNDNTLKILSLASSTGEEAYTLSILVQESGLFFWDWNIRIIGIDIDDNAIRKARTACYTKNSFRALNGNAAFINKYFIVEEDCYELKKSITRYVEFKHGNILDNNCFIGLNGMDIIFCRNVLIYMSDEAINTVSRNLFNCLSGAGYLFIGSAESLIQKTDIFVPEYNNGVIVYKKNVKD